MKAHPQWRIKKLSVRLEMMKDNANYMLVTLFFQALFKFLNEMDDSFRTHLQTVVLFLTIQPDYLEDKVYVDLIRQLAQKLASLNNEVEFYINYVKFRHAELFFKELSKAVRVAGIDFWYYDDTIDWIEAIQPLLYLKSIETIFRSEVQIPSLSHLKFLCSLSVHNLTLSQRKVTFTLPNLKKLKLHNQ